MKATAESKLINSLLLNFNFNYVDNYLLHSQPLLSKDRRNHPYHTSIVLVTPDIALKIDMSSAKKVHFSGTGNVPSPPVSPHAAAKNALSSGLQVLHENIRDNEVITRLAGKFLRLLTLYKSKEKALLKFDNEAYLPLSCRIKVDLKGSSLISKSTKFTDLATKLKEVSTTFQTGTTAVFKAAANLELKAVGKAMMETSMELANLLMKYRLLTNDDACREHKLSHELTIMCILAESVPPNLSMDDDDLAYPGNDEDTYSMMKRLVFDTDLDTVYAYLKLARTPGTQPGPISETEQMVILQVQIELKGTLIACLDKYIEQEKKIQLANKAKEMLLLTATAKSADDSGDVLDDDNDVANILPDSMNDLNKLMQSAIIAHEKAKKTTSDKPVKEKGGASKSSKKKKKKKGTNGGGASANQTNQNTNKSQGKSPGSNQSTSSSTPSQSKSGRRKRRGRAAAAGSDSNAANSSSKRQKSVERS